ncbi:zinc-dependent metalloprotease [Flagellimonas profundi]|uniref:Zinc-dependent metalloprotease n=1 Tax=Flagellimonas profundi TaxID=2915620 RepID=A0ABS3FEP3_9FLAO|nr:zinc-dependent metalloprotease [Allomuricauda profundi]MBO0341513.1 zinc-dependent metalloprotease [Allomuricauda profundi]
MRKFIVLILLFLHFSVKMAAKMPGSPKDNFTHVKHGGDPFLTSFMEGNQLFLTIPDALLDHPMLFVCYDRMRRSYMQVVWSLHKDKILFKQQSIASDAGINLPIAKRITLKDNVLAILPIAKTHGEEGGHSVNITDLILRQDIEWPQKFGVSIGSAIADMSIILDSNNREDEVLIKVRRGMVKSEAKVSVPLFYGFSVLGSPMTGRRFDYRMGFFNEQQDGGFHFALKNRPANILRWRLEKKFKDQQISVPNKPIRFLISPEVPKKWRPYIKAGIEEWLPAFESAGFKDALVVKETDSLDEWQAHSIHSNVVYWNQSKYTRGMEDEDFGGTIGYIVDERSGQILRGDIFMGASVQSVSEKYFVRAAPLDKRAQRFPFPDKLVGSLFQEIAAHEAGHVFGMLDGNFGESTYPWDKMNDSLWLRHMGYTPSVMNYTRVNNLPQPKDGIPPSQLIQRVGPADHYHIQWAYTEFPETMAPEQSEALLEQMVLWQDSVPWYRFNINQLEDVGPAFTNEVVETDNPVRSTEMALNNMQRVMELIPKATQGQKDNSRLEGLYQRTIELWNNQMKYVLSLIGGYKVQYQSVNQLGNPYEPIPWETQMEALDFLITQVLDPPRWLTHPNFHDGLKYSTNSDLVMRYQQSLVMKLIMAHRLKRLEQLEISLGRQGLVGTYLSKVQSELFREAYHDMGLVDLRRQEIQMTFIDGVIGYLERKRIGLTPSEKFLVPTDYSKGLLFQQLLDLKAVLEKGLKRNGNVANIGHWKLCLKNIDEVLQ